MSKLTDLLTTHPYPTFTPHCGQDPVNTIRGILHGTAESRFYADIGCKPCLCEEPVGASVLASEPEGTPLLTEYRYGKGRVIFLGVPLEMTLTTTPGVFHGANASTAWQLFRYIAAVRWCSIAIGEQGNAMTAEIRNWGV
jgi:hypothetical protein